MRGGYKPMGPRPRSYDYPLPMKGYDWITVLWIVRALGLRTALSLKWQEQHLIIVDDCRVNVKIDTGENDE